MQYKQTYPGEIHFEKKNHIAYLRFDNPKNLNALSYAMFASINEIFDTMRDDRDVLGVILTGTGRSFIVGADLKELEGMWFDENGESKYFFQECYSDARHYIHSTLRKIADFHRPTLAAINGYALGGGAELALNCDIRIASSKAKIGFPEGQIGGFPAYTGPTMAVRVLGISVAKEMILTARHFTAEECRQRGFVCEVTEPEALMQKAEEMMSLIVSCSPINTKLVKRVLDMSTEMSLDASLELECFTTAISQSHPDAKEGSLAFFGKRPPVWSIDGK